MLKAALQVCYGGQVFPVVVDPETCTKQGVLGFFSDTAGEGIVIRLARPLLTAEDYWTVLHELLHAVSHCNGLGLSECKVRVLETALRDLLVNNPKLVKGLLKE